MVKLILNKITSIPYDKLLHFIAGVLVAMFFSLLFPITESFCFIFSIAVGICKDLYYKLDYGRFDCLDVLATGLGGLLIQIYIYGYKKNKGVLSGSLFHLYQY